MQPKRRRLQAIILEATDTVERPTCIGEQTRFPALGTYLARCEAVGRERDVVCVAERVPLHVGARERPARQQQIVRAEQFHAVTLGVARDEGEKAAADAARTALMEEEREGRVAPVLKLCIW